MSAAEAAVEVEADEEEEEDEEMEEEEAEESTWMPREPTDEEIVNSTVQGLVVEASRSVHEWHPLEPKSEEPSKRYGLRRRSEVTLSLEVDDGEIRGFGRARGGWGGGRGLAKSKKGGGKPTPQPTHPAPLPQRTEAGEYKCPTCPKAFASSSRLKIHVYQRHGQQLTPVCEACGMQFNTTSALASHRSRKHPAAAKAERLPPAEGISCGLCDAASFPTISDLCHHLSRRHGQPASLHDRTFPDFAAFEAWIEEVERRDQCKFRKRTGAKKRGVGTKVHYFVCHRSGIPKLIPRSEKKADRADRESKKIGFTCSAFINVMELRGSRDTKPCVRIKYCTDHYGHAPGTRFAPGLRKGLAKNRVPGDPAAEDDSEESDEEEEEESPLRAAPPKAPKAASEAAQRRRVYQLLASLKASVDLLSDEARLSTLATGLRSLLDVAKGQAPLAAKSATKATTSTVPPPSSPLPPPTRRPHHKVSHPLEHPYHHHHQQQHQPPPPPAPAARVHGIHFQASQAPPSILHVAQGPPPPPPPPQHAHVLVQHPGGRTQEQRIILHPPPQASHQPKLFSIPAHAFQPPPHPPPPPPPPPSQHP